MVIPSRPADSTPPRRSERRHRYSTTRNDLVNPASNVDDTTARMEHISIADRSRQSEPRQRWYLTETPAERRERKQREALSRSPERDKVASAIERQPGRHRTETPEERKKRKLREELSRVSATMSSSGGGNPFVGENFKARRGERSRDVPTEETVDASPGSNETTKDNDALSSKEHRKYDGVPRCRQQKYLNLSKICEPAKPNSIAMELGPDGWYVSAPPKKVDKTVDVDSESDTDTDTDTEDHPRYYSPYPPQQLPQMHPAYPPIMYPVYLPPQMYQPPQMYPFQMYQPQMYQPPQMYPPPQMYLPPQIYPSSHPGPVALAPYTVPYQGEHAYPPYNGYSDYPDPESYVVPARSLNDLETGYS